VAAKAAGLPCVVVTNDYTSDQDFTEADLVVDSFVGTLTARTLRWPGRWWPPRETSHWPPP
jgi:beta-phosphoglucomutase-like phosphatase (HAD superfamily)